MLHINQALRTIFNTELDFEHRASSEINIFLKYSVSKLWNWYSYISNIEPALKSTFIMLQKQSWNSNMAPALRSAFIMFAKQIDIHYNRKWSNHLWDTKIDFSNIETIVKFRYIVFDIGGFWKSHQVFRSTFIMLLAQSWIVNIESALRYRHS